MSQVKDPRDKQSGLRRRAEEALGGKFSERDDISRLSPEDLHSLVHEFRVHQIELEMQNEELRLAQINVEELKDKFLDLYDFAPVGYLTLNERGLILEANLTAVRLFGLERQSLTKTFLSRFVAQECEAAYYLHLQQIFETRRKQTCEFKSVRQDGTHFYVQLESVAVPDESGRFDRCRTIVSDITERKRSEELLKTAHHQLEQRVTERTAELQSTNKKLQTEIKKRKEANEALRESTELYRAAFANAGVGIDVLDRDGAILEVNEALLNMLGYTNEEFRGITFNDITHPDDRQISRESLEALGKGEISSYRLEKRYVKKDGTILWGDLSASSIRDRNGEHAGTIGVIADITGWKEAQIRVQQSEERLRLIIESAPIGITIVQDGKYAYVNPGFVEMFGYETAEEMLGLPVVTTYLREKNRLIVRKSVDRESGTKIISHYDGIGVRKSGQRMSVAAWVTEIQHLGKQAYLAFVMDLTESKSVRAQLLQSQKMEAVGTLAGGMAHDLNNILTLVVGFSELLLAEQAEQGPSCGDLQKIMEAGQRAADLVGRLLAFSRKVEIRPRPLNLNHQIRQLQSMLTSTIPKMIEIELTLARGLSLVSADPTQMDQVLMNLVVNANDAMPDGGRLAIKTEKVIMDEEHARLHLGTKPGEYVLLSVSDTGHGMDKETLDHIFEPFYTTKEAGKGTGLGLAVVYGIVTQHGGQIRCYSAPGHGATFKIYLPAVASVAEREHFQTATRKAHSRGNRETILLVDDEKFIRELGKRMLEPSGYTVLTAANGKKALKLYKRERRKISLVILDLIMPEMGGKQCLEELLKIEPKVRVLIASGFAADGQTKEAMETGARGFVGKPFNMKGMLQSVREVLDGE